MDAGEDIATALMSSHAHGLEMLLSVTLMRSETDQMNRVLLGVMPENT